MPLRTKEIGKLYFHIGEVSRMFNVNASTIRFWETEFNVIKPHRNKKGTRLYTQADIDNLKLIYHLIKERGYTLEGARQELRNYRKASDKFEAIQSLQRIRKFLTELRDEL
jgi:DNA-binding transcriptional MerR regulator